MEGGVWIRVVSCWSWKSVCGQGTRRGRARGWCGEPRVVRGTSHLGVERV